MVGVSWKRIRIVYTRTHECTSGHTYEHTRSGHVPFSMYARVIACRLLFRCTRHTMCLLARRPAIGRDAVRQRVDQVAKTYVHCACVVCKQCRAHAADRQPLIQPDRLADHLSLSLSTLHLLFFVRRYVCKWVRGWIRSLFLILACFFYFNKNLCTKVNFNRKVCRVCSVYSYKYEERKSVHHKY